MTLLTQEKLWLLRIKKGNPMPILKELSVKHDIPIRTLKAACKAGRLKGKLKKGIVSYWEVSQENFDKWAETYYPRPGRRKRNFQRKSGFKTW